MQRVIKRWKLVLRCFRCRGKFSFRHLEPGRIVILAEVCPCPQCGARPHVPQGSRAMSRHDIFNIEEETESSFRKSLDGDTWHFAHDCSQWPTDRYVVLELPPDVGALCSECTAKEPKRSH